MDYRKFYWLDAYLFNEVDPKFRDTGKLTGLGLYAILHWKAARAKGRHKDRLGLAGELGDKRAQEIADGLLQATSNQAKLELLLGERWKFRLPTASAILTVLWPDDFTVYDWRVAEQVGTFKWLADTKPARVWPKYLKFMEAVRTRPPPQPSLRDYDEYLWGRSQYRSFLKELGLPAELPTLEEERAQRSAQLRGVIESLHGIGWDDGLTDN